ncbi:hypothetical protein VP01_12446g1, partial [Puccinia sorghi]
LDSLQLAVSFGKVDSTGILALSCLNLPPTFRNKISHMCIFRITPGPHSPNPQKFNNLLSPLVYELIQLDTGILIPTHQYPSCWFVKKVAGYASHSATKFCSFCHEDHSNIPNLKLSRRREKEETISSATKSKEA